MKPVVYLSGEFIRLEPKMYSVLVDDNNRTNFTE